MTLISGTRVFLLSMLIFFSTAVSWGQQFIDLVDIGGYDNIGNKYTPSNKSFGYYNYHANVQYPHKFKNNDVLSAKISFNKYVISGFNGSDKDQDLYTTSLQLGLLKQLSEKVHIRALVNPKIASYSPNLIKNAFLMPLAAIIQFKRSENFTYGFGLYYSYELFGNYMTPVIHFNWKINNCTSLLYHSLIA